MSVIKEILSFKGLHKQNLIFGDKLHNKTDGLSKLTL